MQKKMKLRLPPEMKVKEKDIIQAAAILFQRYGFQRVSVEEICRFAGASKATFYKYFRGKEGIVRSFLAIVFDDIWQDTFGLLHSEIDLKEKMKRIITMKQDFISRLGVEIVQGIFEYAPAKAYYSEISLKSMQDFRDFIIAEQRSHKIDPSLNVDLIIAVLRELGRIFEERRLEGVCGDFNELVGQINQLFIFGLVGDRG